MNRYVHLSGSLLQHCLTPHSGVEDSIGPSTRSNSSHTLVPCAGPTQFYGTSRRIARLVYLGIHFCAMVNDRIGQDLSLTLSSLIFQVVIN